jgi:predicted double-glycine peptidase
MKKHLTLLLFFCALFLSCATGRPLPQDSVLIRGVPFFAQDYLQCGPSALAGVINYWKTKTGGGESLTPEQIASEVYSPSARGTLGIDLELYARKLGFEVNQYSGTIADLKQHVDKGAPVIVLVDYGIGPYQRNHFMVVTGYTPNGIIVHTGQRQNDLITDSELNRIWKKTDFWALSVKPSA